MLCGRLGQIPPCFLASLCCRFIAEDFAMLALRLPPEVEKRLDSLAKLTGRTKSYYARQAILEVHRRP